MNFYVMVFVSCIKVKQLMSRNTGKVELDEVIKYWDDCPRGSGYLNEQSLISFLEIFTPHQIKGAMYLATCKGRSAYFPYLCGILHKWKKELIEGNEPSYFDIG